MAKSILQTERECFFCGTTIWLEEHHVFGGANRKKSEKYGLKVMACHRHHNEPPKGVHFNVEARQRLQDYAQRKAMDYYGWDVDTFRGMFGKNHLITEE